MSFFTFLIIEYIDHGFIKKKVFKFVKIKKNLNVVFGSCAEESFPGMSKVCHQEIQHKGWMVREYVVPHCQPVSSCQHFRK